MRKNETALDLERLRDLLNGEHPELRRLIEQRMSGLLRTSQARLRQRLRRANAGDFRGALLGTDLDAVVERLNRPSARKRILFVCTLPIQLLARHSTALRELGEFECFVITMNPYLFEGAQRYFDAAYVLDSPVDIAKVLARARPDLVQVRGSVFNSTYLGVVARVLSPAKVVYEFYDIASLMFSPEDAARRWGTDEVELEMLAEAFVVQHSDGVIHGYDRPAEDALRLRYGASGPMLEFHPFVDASFARPPRQTPGDPTRLVFAGGVWPSAAPSEFYGDAQLHNLIPHLTNSGLTLQAYAAPYRSKQRFVRDYADYFEEVRRNPGFGFDIGVSSDELPALLNRFDYGVMLLYRGRMVVRKEHYRWRLPGKFFTYLEAGLPILVSDELEYAARLVEEFGIGIVVPQSRLPSIPHSLRSQDQEALRGRVAAAQERLSMRTQIQRLRDFYLRVLEDAAVS